MSSPRVAKGPSAAFSSGEVALAFALAVAVETFLFILIVGYFYAWRKGALEWQ